MKDNKGITLVMLIMTVVLMLIIAGLAIYEGIESYEASKVVKFESYMKVIQKEVDILVEQEVDYQTIGTALTDEQKTRLQEIIDNNANVQTSNVSEPKLRYFSSLDIKNIFDLQDIADEIIVNFANREVISLNGIEKNGVMHYVEY